VPFLDHTIVPVSDAASSLRFYTEVLGFESDGEDGPFSVVRVNADTLLLLAPWGTDGGLHYAFALTETEFDAAFVRIRNAGIAYGDSYHDVGNMLGPGREFGAHGTAPSVYVFDPDLHLIELRHYEVVSRPE
jgi:catechol 2,3-dioxygenase-like lactoylglutathione lyase family enzyme